MNGIRLFEPRDAEECQTIFMKNLAKYYTYLSKHEQEAMSAANSLESFNEIAARKNDRLFVVEKDGRVAGYFHFGKEGSVIRIKRVQFGVPMLSLLSREIFPLIETYRKRWRCKSIVGDASPHVVKRFERVPGIRVGKLTQRNVSGKKVGFVQLSYRAPSLKRKKPRV